MRLLLSTRANQLTPVQLRMNDLASIEQSPFDRTKPLRVLTHGWYGDEGTDLIIGASRVLLDYYDFNVLVVDWGEGAQTINYPAAVNRVSPVGAFVASFLDFLHLHGYIDYSRVSLIGFSLGGEIEDKDVAQFMIIAFASQRTFADSSVKMFNVDESTRFSDSIQPVHSSV